MIFKANIFTHTQTKGAGVSVPSADPSEHRGNPDGLPISVFMQAGADFMCFCVGVPVLL